MRIPVTLAVVAALSPSAAVAQPERYELGHRLKAFEAAWEKQTDPAARKRALTGLPKASTQFLAFQLGEAGRALDEARLALSAADGPSAADLWPESLMVVPAARVVDARGKELVVTVKPFYPVKADLPSGLVLTATFDGRKAEVKPDKLPATLTVPLADNVLGARTLDQQLSVQIDCGNRVLLRTVSVSCIENLSGRVADLKAAAKTFPAPGTVEHATLIDRAELLAGLAAGDAPETDYPAAALLTEAEKIVEAGGKPHFTADRPGDVRLSVPTGEKARTACRVFVPKGLDPKKPVPVVVGLHGAGGSENLFFEGYGAGFAVKECQKRGWVFVATRAGAGFLGGVPPVPAVLDKLAERYPIDRDRVFLVGHSMGASHAVELAQQHPGKFAGVALLGGAGRIRKPETFAELPVFVGVGSRDFALNGSRSLNKALTAAGAKKLTYKEYPELEHLVIVREALPEVFSLFNGVAGMNR